MHSVTIPSRTRKNVVHEVIFVHGVASHCTCEAGVNFKKCWHLEAAEEKMEMASLRGDFLTACRTILKYEPELTKEDILDAYHEMAKKHGELEAVKRTIAHGRLAAGCHGRRLGDCIKCGGEGYIPEYDHVQGGICFRCKGTGVDPT